MPESNEQAQAIQNLFNSMNALDLRVFIKKATATSVITQLNQQIDMQAGMDEQIKMNIKAMFQSIVTTALSPKALSLSFFNQEAGKRQFVDRRTEGVDSSNQPLWIWSAGKLFRDLNTTAPATPAPSSAPAPVASA